MQHQKYILNIKGTLGTVLSSQHKNEGGPSAKDIKSNKINFN
jgi:hypothetical protein